MAKKFKTIEEARSYVNGLPLLSLVDLCASLLVENEQADRITITQEQFNAFFKIRGVAADGTAERRGRKPKNQNPEGE